MFDWIRVLFRPGRRLFARELNELQDVLRLQQSRVLSKLLGKYRIIGGLKLRRISPTQFLLTRGTVWIVIDSQGYFIHIPEQLVYDTGEVIGLKIDFVDEAVDENARIPNLFFPSAGRRVIQATVTSGEQDTWPLERPVERIPPNRLREISSAFIAHGLQVRDRDQRIEVTPGAAWIDGERLSFPASVFLPKTEGLLMLSVSGQFRIGLNQRPDELVLGEWRGQYREFAVRSLPIESAFEAVNSLRELRREISSVLLTRGSSTALSRSGDPLDSDSFSPLFSSVWDSTAAHMRSGLRSEPFFFNAASDFTIEGVETGQWWYPRYIETPSIMPEPTGVIALASSPIPRIELSTTALFQEIPAEANLQYAQLTFTGRRVDVRGFGFPPGEYEVLVGGTRLSNFTSSQAGSDGGIVPEPDGTFALNFLVAGWQMNHIISVGPAAASISLQNNSSRAAGSLATIFTSEGRSIVGANLLFRRGPTSATLSVVRVVNGVLAEPLGFGTLTNVQASPSGQSLSRMRFSHPIWLPPGQYALVFSSLGPSELFVSQPGESIIGFPRPALNSNFQGKQWKDTWTDGPIPCITPIFGRPIELRNSVEFSLNSPQPLVGTLPRLEKVCPEGTSINFFVQQGSQFIGLEQMQKINAASTNRFRVEFTSSAQQIPVLQANDSSILGFSHVRTSYWVSRSFETEQFDYIEVDVNPSTPGLTQFFVAVSSNDGQTWEELQPVDEGRWERPLSPTVRRVRADGSTFAELRRSVKLRFEMRVDPNENEFVSFGRYSVRTSQRG